MVKKIFQFSILFLLAIFMYTGCATIINGYQDRVDLINAPDSLQVFTYEGVEIPISTRTETNFSQVKLGFVTRDIKSINLRANKEQVLLFRSGNKEKLYKIYPTLDAGWFILDILSGGIPAFIDAYTGNWNSFQPIIINF